MHQVIRRLYDDAVIDAVFGIEPEVGLNQRGAMEFGEQTRGDLLFADADLERFCAIDLNLERGIIERLRDSEINEPWNAA
jgi:hypothetical protein